MAINDAVSQTAVETWNKRWATSEGRADWLEPHPAVVAILPKLHARGARRVLDLGCGVGRHALLFAEHGFDIAALDGSPAGLPVVRETAAARGLSVSLHKGLADALPYPDAGFDYVLSWNMIHHGTLGDLGRRLGCCRRRYCRPAMRITALAARSRPTPSSSTRSSEKATRIAIAMPRRSSVCSPALICSPSASNCSSGDPARTIGTSSPNVATETPV
jgi:SAM-dependent methyltransferase